MTEKVFRTWQGWRRAIRKAWPNATFEGDRDICQAWTGRSDAGGWDGAEGYVVTNWGAALEATPKASRDCILCNGEGALMFAIGLESQKCGACGGTGKMEVLMLEGGAS